MIRFKDFSIRTKIIFIVVIISSLNSIITTFIQYYYEKKQYNKEIIEKLKILANVIGESNSATIMFEDKKAGTDYLASLKVDKNIENASIFLPDSSLFVTYSRSETNITPDLEILLNKDTSIFTNEHLVINQTIIFEHEKIATIRIAYSLSEYRQKQKQYLLISLVIIGLSIFIATILAYFFQKFITHPIYKLELVMKQISREKDYSIRSKNYGKDEIGILTDGFNKMIAQIEKQNNELKSAKAKSDEALIAKERFLANITHELRTPLNSIIGLSSLIEDSQLNNEQREFLKNIRISSDHLLAIINDLLEFSKIGSGKFKFEKAEFSIRRTLDRIERSMEFELKNRQLDFRIHIDPEIPNLLIGDEFRLNQILINLIGNAIKFTPKGSIKTSLIKLSEDENKYTIEFRVEDTGIGISKDKQEIIFESFTQESSSTNRKYGGTGLGLTITKQLVEMQGGKISVESEKDKGSCFIFVLPFDKKAEPAPEMNPANYINTGNLKILIVDDNAMNLLFTKAFLEKNNFHATISDNGTDAIEKLKNEDFNIVLLDLHMPNIDGYELSQKIRALSEEKKRKIPIIALTAAATINEIKKCFESGMNDYVIKPFKKEELITKILTLSTNQVNGS